MKKSFSVFIAIMLVLTFLFLQTTIIFAASIPLETVTVQVDKEKVAPGEEVTVTVNFGTPLGAYDINVAYENELFDYVRSEGGTENDNGTRVKLSFYDTEGGNNPRTNAKITFKAKKDIVTSNPTDFAVTLEGLSNPDNSQEYDDITTPIKQEVLVEPNYVNYTLELQYTGTIKPAIAKEMKLITSSAMGKNYSQVNLQAEVIKKPSNDAVAKLIATNEQNEEVDLIQNGWGGTEGYALGGKNVKQELNLQGEFSKIGEYSIHIKLIDRSNSDAIIAQKTFNVTVGEEQTQGTTKPENNESEKQKEEEKEKLPTTLPKTGNVQYPIIMLAISGLTGAYFLVSKKKKK